MKRRYPDGPRIKLPRVVAGRLFPRRLPFDPLKFNLDMAGRCGDIAYFRLGSLRVYAVNHPDLLRQILIEQAEKFYKPRLLKLASRRMLGSGLLTSDGALWKQQRRLIQPVFRHERLSIYGALMVDEALRRWIHSTTVRSARSMPR